MKYKLQFFSAIIIIFSALITSFFYTRHNAHNAFSTTLANSPTVVIDAGHGGEDGGAHGEYGMIEKGINLNISLMINELLNFYGINTRLTRTEDISLHSKEFKGRRKTSDIKNRVKLVNDTDNPVLISVHLNSYPNENCKGAQVFYSNNNPMGEMFGNLMQNALKEGLNDGNKRLAKKTDKGIYILNNVNCPAILVECGFMTNFSEAKRLLQDYYQRRLAVCITGGYVRFSNTEASIENSSIAPVNSSFPPSL